jgi:hypothetical protein
VNANAQSFALSLTSTGFESVRGELTTERPATKASPAACPLNPAERPVDAIAVVDNAATYVPAAARMADFLEGQGAKIHPTGNRSDQA